MATLPKKKNEKKSAKRGEDTASNVDKSEYAMQEEINNIPALEDEIPAEEITTKSPTPEPIYEEPVLTQLIVESYEGETEKGLYNGDGEAAFVGGHHYQGEFSDGMMHGHGTYTWDSGLIYEGEFTHNKVTGKGCYKWTDGSIYDGDVCNGLRHGYGTFRSADNKLSYNGQWIAGTRHGKGRMNYDAEGTSYYDGDWVKNIRHGWGHRQYPSSNFYQGMWYNNVRHGDGTMRWLDREQMYSGNWEKGIQQGIGQHIWFLRRRISSQYPMRNMYDGEFLNGLRHGYGTFYYANGARYQGEWKTNLKTGKGRFDFKNGRVYEGTFENDHIIEYPAFTMDGMTTPDLTLLKTRTPLPADQVSIQSNESRNTYGPSFQLDVQHLLQGLPECDREEEATQVIFVIMRYMTKLRRMYSCYSQLGFAESADNTFVMNRMQLWRFIKDCHLQDHNITLGDMDRVLAQGKTDEISEIHSPFTKILMREFTNHLVVLAYHIYQAEHIGTTPVLQWCLSRLIAVNILPHACDIQGYIYVEIRRAENALVHVEQAYEIYKALCTPRQQNPLENSFKMRQFLFMMKDLHLVNNDLTPRAIIDIFASDDPKVTDPEGAINLELEITFLGFFEALVGCAQVYVTEEVVKDPVTPCPSSIATGDQGRSSITASPSRITTSQVGIDDEGVEPIEPVPSDIGSSTRPASEMTMKTGEGSNKVSNLMAATSDIGRGGGSTLTHAESSRKSAEYASELKKSISSMTSMQALEQEGDVEHSANSIHGVGQSEDKEHSEKESASCLHIRWWTELCESMPIDDEQQLDEATRQFNFWTHQVHIFFVRKFFPAATRHLRLLQMVKDNYVDQPEAYCASEYAASLPIDSPSRLDLAISEIVEDQE